MAEDDTNDIMCIDTMDSYTTEDFEQAANDKPLMTLFKRLISNETKENTVLTNVQIMDILKKEFNMDISYIHELEKEIYLNLMKKFLKDWPLWDDFDRSIQNLKHKNDTISIRNKLETNHKNLKAYLSKMLEAARPYMKKVVDNTKEATSNEKTTENMDSDVILQIQCTRQQLNQLFYRCPHPDLKNRIFNVEVPNKITVTSMSLRALLNWPGIRLNVNLGTVAFRRDSLHILKHKLVNKKLNYTRPEPSLLCTNLQMKDVKPISTFYTLKDFCKVFTGDCELNSNERELIQEISFTIKQDFANAPDVNISSQFRRSLNKYPYVRYLYSEVNTEQACKSNSYDLQLEEMITPMFTFNIFKFDMIPQKIPSNWLTIECTLCNVSRPVSSNFIGMLEHFQNNHQGEPVWLCMNCNKSFNMMFLAENRWRHDCQTEIST